MRNRTIFSKPKLFFSPTPDREGGRADGSTAPGPGKKSEAFILFPAIDLRRGQVVRLKEGDPQRQTHYADDPGEVARGWFQSGADWLHVVNLDGAFGETAEENMRALDAILQAAAEMGAKVQFGGGLRAIEQVRAAIDLGISRVMLGTLAVEQPEVLESALAEHGVDAIGVAVDARGGIVRTRGWQHDSGLDALSLGQSLAAIGLRWLAFTDIARDGLERGLNLPATLALADRTGLQVIASGGVRNMNDLYAARDAGLAGAIVGRALYEGKLQLRDWYDQLAQD